MTNTGWLDGTDPGPMLNLLAGKASQRKLRLFACAAVRRIWDVLGEPGRRVVELSERFADGRADPGELRLALEDARKFQESIPTFEEPGYLHYLGDAVNIGYWRFRRPLEVSAVELVRFLGPELKPIEAATRAAEVAAGVERADAWENAEGEIDSPARDVRGEEAHRSRLAGEMNAQAALLCDVFGRPGSAVAVDRPWLTPGIVGLARTVYRDRCFDRMPGLADALEASGCDDVGIRDHCRLPVEHVRGCWVIDLLLSKE